MKKRSYKQLIKAMTEEQFNEFCKNLAEEYACLDFEFARKYFCEKYNISQSCYYRILEHAVITNLIDDVTYAKIMYKSAINQSTYFESSGGSSIAKYNRLYIARCQYIANNLPKEKIKEITNEFLRKSKYRVAVKFEISTRTVDFVLARAITENIVDDIVANLIVVQSGKKAKPEEKEIIKMFFEEIKNIMNNGDKLTT